jgi:tetratricopeptide (TPR) repeat protein
MKHYDRLIQDCDVEIRAGRAISVSRWLNELNTARIPREYRLPLAKICRRAGLYSLGMRLLSSLIHSKMPRISQQPATPEELAEYAVLLIRIGAVSEGMKKLNRLEMSATPEALLYRAFGHFGQWEYQDAIADLQLYLAAPLTSYAKLVGRMNLALAYVEVRNHNSALELLKENIEWAARDDHRQLQSNCHGLCAQTYIQQEDFSRARKELSLAQNLISLAGTNDHRFIEKLNFILTALETQSTDPLDELRAHSIKHHAWEASREADLYRLKIDFKEEAFDHLYFGTPFRHFRDLVSAEFGRRPRQLSYLLGAESAPCLDLQTALVGGTKLFKSGQKCHQLIEILLRDFYQPLRIAGLFSALFPDEQFNISSSPVRVRQLLWRTRRWLKAQNIPVAIAEANDFYSLRVVGQFSFRIPLERQPVNPFALLHSQLFEMFGDAPFFLAKEAQNRMCLPKSTIRKLIKYGIENETIEKFGETNSSAKYRIFKTKADKQAA